MARIRKKNTKPEMVVRQAAHRLGYRFRLHSSDLPGTPDLVFPRLRKAIFVNGCFWHQHQGCRLAKLPKSRPEYWIPKLQRNAERDRVMLAALQQLEWDVLVIWECEVRDSNQLESRLSEFLGSQLPS